jgi:hypothetical protein
MAGPDASMWSGLATEVEASAYGGRTPADGAQRDLLTKARRTRVRRRGRHASDDLATAGCHHS